MCARTQFMTGSFLWADRPIMSKVAAIFQKDYFFKSNNVPATKSTSPTPDFLVSFSPNTKYEKKIVTRILNLSIGTTTLAGPVCSARK